MAGGGAMTLRESARRAGRDVKALGLKRADGGCGRDSKFGARERIEHLKLSQVTKRPLDKRVLG